jgi:hypothetical protein
MMMVFSGFLTRSVVEHAASVVEHAASVVEARRAEFEPGRQGTGYLRLFIKDDPQLAPAIQRALGALNKPADDEFWDAYLLLYPLGAYIPPHLDEAAAFGKKHHRLNAIVRRAGLGGRFVLAEQHLPLDVADAVLFEPDEVRHSVTEVLAGERVVFSVGCWL